jgi:uncharacterized protein (TIGR03118 family)
MDRRGFLISSASAGLLAACGSSERVNTGYAKSNLVASAADQLEFKPALTQVERGAEFIDAWGIAIRPAGAGGHFWVTAGGWSYQFVGDVASAADASLNRLFQDALTLVRLPGAGAPDDETDVTNTEKFVGFGTGVVFNGADLNSDRFRVKDQRVQVGTTEYTLEGSARFIFATDSGVISGWTERDATSNQIIRRNGAAVAMADGSGEGHAYFGLAIKPGSWDRLWVADFGAAPQLRIYDHQWQLLAPGTAFANPFMGSKAQPTPGDYAPFNVQVLRWQGQDYVFVAYAKTQPDPENPQAFYAGEEDAKPAEEEGERPDRGRVAIFTLEGALVQTLNDDGRLNAPWGLAVAPKDFGHLGGKLLVGNFGGEGRIAAYDLERNTFVEYLSDPQGERIAIEGLWGLQFGNGASLGDANALYFAAGPGDEKQGLFGALRSAG